MRCVFRCAAAAAIGLVLSRQARAEGSGRSPNDRESLTVYFENDLFADTDRHYTNGVRVSWLSEDLETLESWPAIAWLKERIPWFAAEGWTHNVGLAAGQSIYTPENIAARDLVEEDRPYAGWLYGTLSLHRKSETELHTLHLTVGVIGEESFGEEAQNGVHEFRDIPTANGWDNQLGSELGLMLGYDYKQRWAWQVSEHNLLGVDLIPGVGARVGNVLTRATAGVTLRLGWNIPADFHGNRIDASGYTMPHADGEGRNDHQGVSLYMFASVQGFAVAHNVFLDGNTFRDSHEVEPYPFVGQADVGVGVRYRGLRVTYGQVLRGREFRDQNDTQQFGSMSLAFAWAWPF